MFSMKFSICYIFSLLLKEFICFWWHSKRQKNETMYTFLSKDNIGLKSLKIRGCHTYYKFILLFGRIMTYAAVVYFEYWYKYFKYSQQGCLFSLLFYLCNLYLLKKNRSCRPEVFLGKGVLKICSKCTGEHLCRSAISVKLLCNFTEIELSHGCSPVNLSHIFRTPFLKNTSGRLLQKKLSHISWVRTCNSQDWVTVKHLKELVMLILLWLCA